MRTLTVLLAVLLVAAIWDYLKGKVPNFLIVTGAAWGVFRLCLLQGGFGILSYLPGVVIPLILFWPLFKIGTLGAGDLKLFSLLGFYLPFFETLYCIAVSFLLAAALAVLLMFRRGNFSERIAYLFSYLRDILSTGRIRYYYGNILKETIEDSGEELSRMHLAGPVFLGTLLVVGGGFL